MRKICLFVLIAASVFFAGEQHLQTSTNWTDFVFWEGDSWSPHFTDRQTLSAVYGISKQTGSQPEEVSSRFLERHHRLFGVANLSELRLVRREHSDLGAHLYYQQYFADLPVEGSGIAIHLNHSQQIIAATSSFHSGLKQIQETVHSLEEARQSAARLLRSEGKASGGKLIILPLAGAAKRAWKLHVDSRKFSQGSWLVYVDADRPNVILRALKTQLSSTGKGKVYNENPVVTPELVNQEFLYLQSKKLNGKFLKTLNANAYHDINEFQFSDFTTASDPNRKYNFKENDLRLAEAMHYFQINRVHDQWKQFGLTVLNSKAPVFVNVTEEDGGKGLDNAFYARTSFLPETGAYVFGAGHQLENLGMDADIYYHEYGHGVLDLTRPQLLEAFESSYPRSFHEGFGDISAAAITGNSKIGEFGLRFKQTKQFIGRDLENDNRYPQDVIDPQLKKTEIHHAGLIIGGAWWDLQKTIGRENAQRILFKALPLLPKEMNFFDVRDSMLVTDSVIHQGLHQQAIQNAFSEHGITGTDPGQTGRLRITDLKTALYRIDTGRISLKQQFQPGDLIVVLAEYEAENVTPGYNMIPEWIEISGPSSHELVAFAFADEVVKGRHRGLRGALQLVLETDLVSTKGRNKIITRSRLGGTSHIGAKRSVSFTMN